MAGWGRVLGTGALAVVMAGVGCSDATDPVPNQVWSSQVTNVVFEVDYAEGAEPYSASKTGPLGHVEGIGFALFRTNVERLLEGRSKTITIVDSLAALQKLTDVSGADFTQQQILDIAERHRDSQRTADTVVVYVVWLPGYLNDGTTVRTDVLGASFGDAGVIGMFYPVIAAQVGDAQLPVAKARLMEQATLIHEAAHALGLVDRGVALTSPHRDPEASHGRHCDNAQCIMHYTLESVTTVKAFVEGVAADGSTVVFDDACLADADAAK